MAACTYSRTTEQCWISAMKQFQRKSHKNSFAARWVSCVVCGTSVGEFGCGQTDRQRQTETDRQTQTDRRIRTTTVTLAAHARRGLITQQNESTIAPNPLCNTCDSCMCASLMCKMQRKHMHKMKCTCKGRYTEKC